jgi:hypothetical protein
MTIAISTYTDPGVYQAEVIEPGSVSTNFERTPCVVAIAPRTRRVTNESIVRGKVFAETVAGWSGSTPYRAILTYTSNRDRNNAILYQNGNALGLGDWSFIPATINNSATPGTPVNTTVTTIPAYLLGGNGATAVLLTWTVVGDGEFTISIDGVVYNVLGLNFGACANMNDVATVIQVGIRALTPTHLETCTWSVDHFIVSSVSVDPFVSDVSVTSAVPAGAGTDISGAGGTAFMDSDVGNGTEMPPVSSGTRYFTLSLDGKKALAVALTSGISTPLTTIATDINTALNASPIYGATYATVASTYATTNPNDTLKLTSPTTTSASDIKIFLSPLTDGASVISSGSWVPSATTGIQPNSTVEIIDASYISGATYTIEYVTVETVEDPLADTTVTDTLSNIVVTGSYPGSSSFVKNQDYENGATVTIDWNVAAYYHAANVTATVAGPYTPVLNISDRITFSLNGLAAITVTFTAGVGVTAATLAAEINAALAASSTYGPEYAWTASNNAGSLKWEVRTPFQSFPVERGYDTSIIFYTNTRNAFSLFFGATTLPYEIRGAALRPSFGDSYYCTYDYNRPASNYLTPWLVYNPAELYGYCSPLTVLNYTRNKLAIAGGIAFENSASSLWLQQINDSTVPGTPTSTQIHTAIDSCEQKSGITDIVVIDTSTDTAVYLMTHVADQSSMLNKHYRRGWFGMARSTAVGDPDTANTLVYRATRTLQPGNTSPGRGRLILVAPSTVTRTVTLDDGREIDVEVDGSYVATAIMALYTSLPSPSDVLINKTITGFKIDDFETYLTEERHTLAGNGVCVVTEDAGRLILLDPLTTEAGGGKVVSFEEPASSAQKDAVTSTVDTLLYNNVVGVVPDDLADFITDIKKWIMLAIIANINNGTIGPYKNTDGSSRDIDPKTDIQVFQSSTDPRTYLFKYWYNLKYPAKRFFGEYSVDNPFWAPAA